MAADIPGGADSPAEQQPQTAQAAGIPSTSTAIDLSWLQINESETVADLTARVGAKLSSVDTEEENLALRQKLADCLIRAMTTGPADPAKKASGEKKGSQPAEF